MPHWVQQLSGGMHMSGWTRASLFAALNAAGIAAVLLVLGSGPALADPDPVPGDPGVVAAPPAPPPPFELPPLPGLPPPPPPQGDPLGPPPPPWAPPVALPAAAG